LPRATRVYAELEKMGLVSGETGRGTFVREILLPSGQGSISMRSPPMYWI
jgi:DNA-binding transcriptional regulator YhcF (GntR family)